MTPPAISVPPAVLDSALAGDPQPLEAALDADPSTADMVAAVTSPRRRLTVTVADADGLRRSRGFVGDRLTVLQADGDDRERPAELVRSATGAEVAHLVLTGVGFGVRPDDPLRWPVPLDAPGAVVDAALGGDVTVLGDVPDPGPGAGPVRWWAIVWDDGDGRRVVAALDAGGWWRHDRTRLVPTSAAELWTELAAFAAGPSHSAD